MMMNFLILDSLTIEDGTVADIMFGIDLMYILNYYDKDELVAIIIFTEFTNIQE